MKTLFVLCLLAITGHTLFAQTAYIQVTGEPDLSVYLNNKYKGKTTAELNGYIIENVSPGSNLIKIEKDGFTPFEEYVTVKPGEVFSYKVKPFTKHLVKISEQGSVGETAKKARVETGKLIIQSVPIEIKITIAEIDGILNSAKTRDEWQADNIPAGSYDVTFTFNQKVINKTIEIRKNDTTRFFINMLNGSSTVKSSLDERMRLDNIQYLKDEKVFRFVDSLCKLYKFKAGLTASEFRRYNPEADAIMLSSNFSTSHGPNPPYRSSYSTPLFVKNKDKKPGPNSVYFHPNGKIELYSYFLIYGSDKAAEAAISYNKIVAQIESTIPAEFIVKYPNLPNTIKVKCTSLNTQVDFTQYPSYSVKDKSGLLDITFHSIKD
jgi:hypothetical protein